MLKSLKLYLESMFGQQPWEKLVSNTKNQNLIKMLKFIAIMRFILFPISFVICLLGMTAELLMIISAFISRSFIILFELVNDSAWINVAWFGLTFEDIDNEMETLKPVKRTRVPKAETSDSGN